MTIINEAFERQSSLAKQAALAHAQILSNRLIPIRERLTELWNKLCKEENGDTSWGNLVVSDENLDDASEFISLLKEFVDMLARYKKACTLAGVTPGIPNIGVSSDEYSNQESSNNRKSDARSKHPEQRLSGHGDSQGSSRRRKKRKRSKR